LRPLFRINTGRAEPSSPISMRRQTAASLISVNEIVLSRPNTGGQPAAICTSRLSRSNAVVCGGVNTASNTAVTTNENTEPSTWLLPAIAGQINQLNVPTARAGTRMPRPRFAPVPSSTTKSEPLSVIFTCHSHRELWPRGQPVQYNPSHTSGQAGG